MKTTIRILLPLLALGVATSVPLLRAADETTPPTQRQKGAKGGQRGAGAGGMLNPDQALARLDKALTLSEDQKTQIKDIYAKTRDEVQTLAPEERRTKARDLLQSTRSQVRATLTPDQQKKFDEMPQAARGAGGGQNRRKKAN